MQTVEIFTEVQLMLSGHAEFFFHYNPVDHFNHFQSILCVLRDKILD